MPDSQQRLARFTTNLPRLRARAEMLVFLRRMAWLCVAIVALVVAGTVGFVVTEGTRCGRAFAGRSTRSPPWGRSRRRTTWAARC